MAELSAYASPVDSERIAERVALDYVGEKIGATLGGARRRPQSGPYVTGIGSVTGFVVGGLGASAYRTAPSTAAPSPTPKLGTLRSVVRQKSTVLPNPVGKALAMPDPRRLPISIYNDALASQVKMFRNYEPTGMRLVMENWTPRPKQHTEIRALWGAFVSKFFEMQVQELAVEDTAQERWVDEGLRHPPLESIQRIHVRPNLLGPLLPRIAYDPDRE